MERTAWFVVHPKGLVVRREGGAPQLLNEDDAAALGIERLSAHGVRSIDDLSALAAPLDGAIDLHEPYSLLGLRDVFAQLGAETFALAGRAAQLVEWATTHRFCGRCASPTERAMDERCLKCPKCGLQAWPRISPAIIVLVRKGDEALLARTARFPGAFSSPLAGFSELGESLEETLAREVREEVGVEVKNPRYLGSQPWPFPHSLMIGFHADWAGGEIQTDGKEIAEAAWFRHDALPKIPPKLSIARQLIDAWTAEIAAKSR